MATEREEGGTKVMPSPGLATRKLQAGKVISLASLAVKVTKFRGDDGHGRSRRMNCSRIFLRRQFGGYPVRWRSACGEVRQLAVHRPPVRLHRGLSEAGPAICDHPVLPVTKPPRWCALTALRVDVGDDERLAL